ncbi:hypothetical protein C8F01DRAFT_1125580 [Mycena amicta]|nr:hypothetical protein C8F01DRAFT_1125580 [Mycena amicta]
MKSSDSIHSAKETGGTPPTPNAQTVFENTRQNSLPFVEAWPGPTPSMRPMASQSSPWASLGPAHLYGSAIPQNPWASPYTPRTSPFTPPNQPAIPPVPLPAEYYGSHSNPWTSSYTPQVTPFSSSNSPWQGPQNQWGNPQTGSFAQHVIAPAADSHSFEPLLVAANPFDRPSRKRRRQNVEAHFHTMGLRPQATVHFQQTPQFIPTPPIPTYSTPFIPPLSTPPSSVSLEVDPAGVPLPASDTSSESESSHDHRASNENHEPLRWERDSGSPVPAMTGSRPTSPQTDEPIPPPSRPVYLDPTATVPATVFPTPPQFPGPSSSADWVVPPGFVPFRRRPSASGLNGSWSRSSIDWTDATTLPLPITTPLRKYNRLDELVATVQAALMDIRLVEDALEKVYGYVILLRIPSLYFSRVARVFEDARTSIPDIHRMARARSNQWKQPNEILTWADYDPEPLPSSLIHLRASWESFIDSLMREWKTINVVSVLLMSAILTLLQIESAAHPITRTTALFSLLCSLMSLLYGCIYIIRFGTMRKMHKASSFAKAVETDDDAVNIWWNVWVMLAMPSTWLAWSIITFLASIMSFIWLTGSSQDSLPTLSTHAALGVRLALSLVLALGLVYFVLIVREFQRYGDVMDREWIRSVVGDLMAARSRANWGPPSIFDATSGQPQQNEAYVSTPSWYGAATRAGYSAETPTNPPSRSPPFSTRSWYGAATRAGYSAETPTNPPSRSPPFREMFPDPDPAPPLTDLPFAVFERPEPTSSKGISSYRLPIMQLGNAVLALEDWLRTDPEMTPELAKRMRPHTRLRFVHDITNAWAGQHAPRLERLSPTPEPKEMFSPPSPTPPFSPDVHELSGSQPQETVAHFSSPAIDSAEMAASDTSHRQNRSSDEVDVTKVEESPETAQTSSAALKSRMQVVQERVDLWNAQYFYPRHLEAMVTPAIYRTGNESSEPELMVTVGYIHDNEERTSSESSTTSTTN